MTVVWVQLTKVPPFFISIFLPGILKIAPKCTICDAKSNGHRKCIYLSVFFPVWLLCLFEILPRLWISPSQTFLDIIYTWQACRTSSLVHLLWVLVHAVLRTSLLQNKCVWSKLFGGAPLLDNLSFVSLNHTIDFLRYHINVPRKKHSS